MKIVTVIGARPQFIKSAMVSKALFQIKNLEEVIVHTGQHFDTNMSSTFFIDLQLHEPKYNLNINSLSNSIMIFEMVDKLNRIICEEKPDLVLVYGDANSTLAGALAANNNNTLIAHVEAGLRSYNNHMQEEKNRVKTDSLSSLLFCPSEQAVTNLKNEGIKKEKIILCGDVMFDSILFFKQYAKKPNINLDDNFILCTLHRAENTDNSTLADILKSLEKISEQTPVVFPVHPRTLKKLNSLNYNFHKSNVMFIEPVGYFEMIWLLENTNFVITDSGGLQKEAYFTNKRCLILRNETEWVELLENNNHILAGTNYETIFKSYQQLLNYIGDDFNSNNFLYGTGNAASIIANSIANFLKCK